MSVAGWVLFAAFVVVLAVRVTLTELTWPEYRVEVVPRRVVGALDVVIAVVLLALVVTLAAVVAPPLLAR